MNGDGSIGGGGGEEVVTMEEDVKGKKIVFMWGYLPGALPQRSPLLSPVVVRLPGKDGTDGKVWRDVCGGGCGFAMAISDTRRNNSLLVDLAGEDMGQVWGWGYGGEGHLGLGLRICIPLHILYLASSRLLLAKIDHGSCSRKCKLRGSR